MTPEIGHFALMLAFGIALLQTAARRHAMIHTLQADLKAHPGNAREWVLLGRGRQVLAGGAIRRVEGRGWRLNWP